MFYVCAVAGTAGFSEINIQPPGGTAAADSRPLGAVALRSVQRFISESESTRDLAASSGAASRLLRTVCEILRQQGASLISPRMTDTDFPSTDGGSLPNRVIFRHQDPGVVAQRAIAAAEQLWRSWIPQGAAVEMPEFTWVSTPSIGSESEQHAQLQKLLDARKRTAKFEQTPDTYGSAADRTFEVCPLTGRYPVSTATFPGQRPTDRRASSFVLTKRNSFARSGSFPSTSTIAVSRWIAAVAEAKQGDAELAKAADDFVSARNALGDHAKTRALPFFKSERDGLAATEGSWLLREDWSEKALAKELGEGTAIDRNAWNAWIAFRSARDALFAVAADVGLARPTPYLALVVVDGDGIGKRFGRLQSDNERVAVSQRLAECAADQRHSLETDYLCRVVYAGGDDMFAIVAASDALKVAISSAELVRNALAAGLSNITCSAGVLWMHARSGLQSGVKRTQQLVVEAKGEDLSKARLKYAVRTGGGERTSESFSIRDESLQPIETSDPETEARSVSQVRAFEALVSSFANGGLSPALIRDLERQSGRIPNEPSSRNAFLSFLAVRHCPVDEGMRANLIVLNGQERNWNRLINHLVAAQFLARESGGNVALKAQNAVD